MDNPFAILIIEALQVTSIQLLGIFGIFFLLGFLLSKLQTLSNSNYRRAFGWKGILWTAWLGTPFHELGHYLFAVLFRHKINAIALFKPNKETGGLGHVDHSYKKSSIYQTLGNFFIGAAPMIFGTGILFLLLFFLLQNGKEIITLLVDARTSYMSLLATMPSIFGMIFAKANLVTWQFWLFLYLSFAISSHIAPSKQDRKGMWSGFFWIVLMVFLINVAALLLRFDLTSYILSTARYLNVLTAVTLYALLMSILHYLFTLLFVYPVRMLRKTPPHVATDIPVYDKRKN